jgi:hypothetical protein
VGLEPEPHDVSMSTIDQTGALSLTQYLGRLRAFVDTLHAEAVTVATYVRRLEGQDRNQAFGWESILDRARSRIERVTEHWLRFNQELDGRVYPDDLELRLFGEHHKLRYRYAETCSQVLELSERINRYIDEAERFDRQDVKLISALVEEVVSRLGEEARAAREVGLRLMATALDSPAEGPPPYDGLSFNQASAYLEDYTAARRSFEDELSALEAA